MASSTRRRYLALIADALREPERRRPPRRAQRRSGETLGGRPDAQDSAILLAGFQGLPHARTPTLHYVRSSADGTASAFAWVEDSGLVYILD